MAVPVFGKLYWLETAISSSVSTKLVLPVLCAIETLTDGLGIVVAATVEQLLCVISAAEFFTSSGII